jgi:hypothetical protein
LPHGMCSTHKDQINVDLLAFLGAEVGASKTATRSARALLEPQAPRPTS